MARAIDKRMRFKAVDNVSGVVDRISSRFPKLSRNVSRTSKQFDRLEKKSANLKRKLSRIGGGMKSVGTAMTVGLTAPIAAFGMSAFRVSKTFDTSMNKVQALTGATGKELDSLRDKAKLLGSETAFSASQSSDAMAFFAQAGFKTNEILSATGPTLALASASGTDLAKTADIMSNVMGGFNIKALEAGRVSDILAKATASGNINMEMLGESMKDAAPVALKFGASLEETAALTAKLGDAGIQGSKAGTTLKNMFLNLGAPTKKIKGIMTDLGVKVFDKTTNKMRSMTDILVDMNKAFASKNLNKAQKLGVLNEVFGKRAIAGAGVLLNAVSKLDPKTGKLVNTVAELNQGLIDSKGHAKKMQETMEKGLPGSVNSLKSAFEGMQIAIMDSGLKEFLASIINKITGVFRWISKLNPTILKMGAIFAGVVAVMGPVIGVLGIVISFLPMLITGFETLIVLFPFLTTLSWTMMLPFIKFIAIAALVVGAIWLIKKNWGAISSFVGSSIDWMLKKLNQFGDYIENVFTGVLAKPMELIDKMSNLSSSAFGSVADFFGLGSSDGEKDIISKAVGPSISGELQGKDTGSKDLVKKNFEFMMRKQQASVDIKFANLPQGAGVMTDDRDNLLNVDPGFMGAF